MANILLGVSAGIAIYKSADLASKLTQRGDCVRTLMTPHSLKFMTPLAFRAVTGQEVYTDTFEDDPSGRIEHISLTEWGDLLLIAPATADLLGNLAAGLGSNILTATALAFSKPVLNFRECGVIRVRTQSSRSTRVPISLPSSLNAGTASGL